MFLNFTQGGNYTSGDKEIDLVISYLDSCGILYRDVYKSPNSDDEDVIAVFDNGEEYSFEVKEELHQRWNKYHQYGIDGISTFQFISPAEERRWKGHVWSADQYYNFCDAIDYNKHYKAGKISYSKADVWLFVCYNGVDSIDMMEGYWGEDIQGDFVTYLKDCCPFAINSKNHDRSKYDKWNSFVWYVDPENMPEPIDWDAYYYGY